MSGTYYGYDMPDRLSPGGWWVAWKSGVGYLKADTKQGLRQLIRHTEGRD